MKVNRLFLLNFKIIYIQNFGKIYSMSKESIMTAPSIIKGWDKPQNEYCEYEKDGKLLKLVTHFWNACNLKLSWLFCP